MTSTPIEFGSLDHLTLVVADLKTSEAFYCGLLGMQVVPRPDFDFPGLWLQAGDFQLHLTLTNEASGTAGWSDRDAKRVSRGHHFAFAVKDVDAASDFLLRNEIEIVSGPKSRPDGPIQIYFFDPDQHLIELFSFPE